MFLTVSDEPNKYILLSAHGEENSIRKKTSIAFHAIKMHLRQKVWYAILYSCHPRSKNPSRKEWIQAWLPCPLSTSVGFNDLNKFSWTHALFRTAEHSRRKALSIFHRASIAASASLLDRAPRSTRSGRLLSLPGITTNELLQATDMAIERSRKELLGKPCPDYTDETVSWRSATHSRLRQSSPQDGVEKKLKLKKCEKVWQMKWNARQSLTDRTDRQTDCRRQTDNSFDFLSFSWFTCDFAPCDWWVGSKNHMGHLIIYWKLFDAVEAGVHCLLDIWRSFVRWTTMN
jgi:hypothetical protein